MGKLLAVPILAGLILAGCATPAAVSGDEPEFFATTLYLAPDGLQDEPASGATAIDWGTEEWIAGTTLPPTWTGGGSAQERLVRHANLSVQYSVESLILGTQGVRSEWTAWFGVGPHIVDHIFVDSVDVLTPGMYEVTFNLRLPNGGLRIPAGETLTLMLASYHERADGSLALVYGEDTKLELKGTQTSAETYTYTPRDDVQAPLVGGYCMGEIDPVEQAAKTIVLDVPDSSGVSVAVSRSDAPGMVDVDLIIRAADGTYIDGSHGPGSVEAARVWPDQHAAFPGPLTVIVFACQAQVSDVMISISEIQNPYRRGL